MRVSFQTGSINDRSYPFSYQSYVDPSIRFNNCSHCPESARLANCMDHCDPDGTISTIIVGFLCGYHSTVGDEVRRFNFLKGSVEKNKLPCDCGLQDCKTIKEYNDIKSGIKTSASIPTKEEYEAEIKKHNVEAREAATEIVNQLKQFLQK